MLGTNYHVEATGWIKSIKHFPYSEESFNIAEEKKIIKSCVTDYKFMAVSEKVLSVSMIWSQWINRIWKGKTDIPERYRWCFTDRQHSEKWAKIHHFLPTTENWRTKKINWRKFSMGGSLKFWLTSLGNLYWKESTSIFKDRRRGKFPKISSTFWWWVRNKVRLTPESRYSAEGVDRPTTKPVLSCLPGHAKPGTSF